MAITKHKLTTKADHIVGTSGKDLFLAPLTNAASQHKPTLTNDDRLDGGAGTDTISAALSGTSLTPWLKNIEQAVFSHKSSSVPFSLDLAHATALKSLSFNAFNSEATVSHASHVSKIDVSNISGLKLVIDGIDETAVSTEHLNFKDTTDEILSLATADGGDFGAIDMSLSNSVVKLFGVTHLPELAIHSNGNKQNAFYFASTGTAFDVEKLTISGHAALDLSGANFTSLTSVSAADMHGNLVAVVGGTSLTSVMAGSGDDTITLSSLGGTMASKATVDLGAGNDDLVASTSLTLDSTTQTFVGGAGVDRLEITGNLGDLSPLFSGFETLSVGDATGTYTLGSEWATFIFRTGNASTDQVVLAGSSLTSVTGSSDADYFGITALDGTQLSKAEVDLGAGDDFVDLTMLTLNSATQSFEGGNGTDGFSVSGNVANFAALFHGFEYMYMDDATGTYDFANSGIYSIILGNAPATSVTFNNMASGSFIQVLATQAEFMTVNVANAASLDDESLKFELDYTADFGNSTVGLSAPDLSYLHIGSFTNHHTMYLTTVGGSANPAGVDIYGDSALTLIATNASTSYISKLTILDPAGVDISGLANGSQAFVSTGAAIEGGDGNDILVGGAGNDTISTGGGNNTVHGSLGADVINLLANSGADTIIFDAQGQSPYNAFDVVNNFGTFDTIDISPIVSSVTFAGNYATFAAGVSHLSTGSVTAFYDTGNDHLYVDLNHDGAIDAAHDLDVKLDIASLNSGNLVA